VRRGSSLSAEGKERKDTIFFIQAKGGEKEEGNGVRNKTSILPKEKSGDPGLRKGKGYDVISLTREVRHIGEEGKGAIAAKRREFSGGGGANSVSTKDCIISLFHSKKSERIYALAEKRKNEAIKEEALVYLRWKNA